MKQNKKQLLHERQLTRCWNTHGAGHNTLCGIFGQIILSVYFGSNFLFHLMLFWT